MKTITSDKQVQTVSQSEMEKQLIKMVEERPSLFAVDDKHYTNRRVKTETWRQISEEMNISERELRKKWDSLRTQYGRYRKLPTSGSSAVEKTSRQKWVLRRLRFLEPHLKRERTFTLAHKEPTAPNDTGTGASAVDQWQEEIESEEDLTMPIGESAMSDQETSNTPCTSAEPPLGELTTVSQSEMEEQLIKMVEERPSLFAVDDKHYKNLRVKTESWRQISEEMNISERELRKRWDSLRTQYGRYRKLPPSGSSAAEKTSRQKWVLRRLQFLEPHLKRRERTLNKEPTAPNDTGTGASAVDQWQEEIESEEDLTMPIGESAMSDQETSNTPCTSAEPPLGELTTVSQSEMEEQLIKMVEERPSLFAVDDKHYKNRRVKTESWRQISEEMNISERELRKRWDSLRTQYGRYRKLPPSGSSAVEKTSRQKWVLRRLQFLEPHLMRERTLNKEPTAPNDTGTGASVDVRLDDEWQEEIESEEDLTMPIGESAMSDQETSNTPCTSAEPPLGELTTVSQSEMEEQLIKMVEERPSLFAVDDKHYKNRRVKTESWRQISEEMNISERELRKRWDSLRTQYGRYRKLPPSGSSAVEKTSRQKWVLRRLQFLEPHLMRERTLNKEPTAPNDTGTGASVDVRLDDEWQEEIESEDDLTMPISESSMSDLETSNTPCASAEPPAKRSRSFQRDDASESSQGLMRLMGAVLERRSTQPPEDFITVACKCIEHKYRMMPPHLVTRLDHNIQNVIFNFCEEHNVTLQQSSASGQDP